MPCRRPDVDLAVPKLSAALRPTSSELLWIVDIYGFVLAGALIPMGVLGDRVGRRRLRRQRKLADPFIDLDLFRRMTFSAALAVNIFGFFVAFGAFLLIAQYFQLILGLSPLVAGLWSAPSGIAFVVGAMLTPRIANHVKPPHVIAGGFLMAALGFGLLTQTGRRTISLC